MVGPAPDKQMPRRPGWVDGVRDEVISGKAEICGHMVRVYTITSLTTN